MPFPTVSQPMSGDMEITIIYSGGTSVTINDNFVGSWTPSHSPVIRTSDRISGTTSSPSKQLDNPSTVAVIYLNKWSDVQYLLPDSMDGDTFVLGGAVCTPNETATVNFHYTCDEDDSRDMTYPVAELAFEDTNERNATDELAVNLYFYPKKNPLGQVQYGSPLTS